MPDFDPLAESARTAVGIADEVKPPDARDDREGIVDADAIYGSQPVTVTVTQLRPPDPDAFNLSPRRRKADGSRVPTAHEWTPGEDDR